MKRLALSIAVALCGCSLSMGIALGPEHFRIIEAEYSGEGAGTFCWEGFGMNNIGLHPLAGDLTNAPATGHH